MPRNVGDGVPASAVHFIAERVQRFYENPNARVEMLKPGSERYRMFSQQAHDLRRLDGDERARLGRDYLESALDGSHDYSIVASVGNRIASAVSVDIRHGEMQVNKLGSAHTGGGRGAATAVEHHLARYAADNGRMSVSSEMPVADAHHYHVKIGRQTDRHGRGAVSEWSPADARQIAREVEADLGQTPTVRSGAMRPCRLGTAPRYDRGTRRAASTDAHERFTDEGGRIEVIENRAEAGAGSAPETSISTSRRAAARTFRMWGTT